MSDNISISTDQSFLEWNLTDLITVRLIPRAQKNFYCFSMDFYMSTRRKMLERMDLLKSELDSSFELYKNYPCLIFSLRTEETVTKKSKRTTTISSSFTASSCKLSRDTLEEVSLSKHICRKIIIALETQDPCTHESCDYNEFELTLRNPSPTIGPLDLTAINMLNLYSILQVEYKDFPKGRLLHVTATLEEHSFLRFFRIISQLTDDEKIKLPAAVCKRLLQSETLLLD